jgi:dihydroorotase
MAVRYLAELKKLDGSISYLMTLYLTPRLTIDEVVKSKGIITGIKLYPKGVTTNSDDGNLLSVLGQGD